VTYSKPITVASPGRKKKADQPDLWLGRIVWGFSGRGLVLALWPEGLAADLLAPLRTDLLESVSFDTEGVPTWFFC
jgi:hypothetical protein